MWLPFIVITFVWGPASPGVDSTWVLWSGAQFSHFQGLATVWTILFKPDIRACFLGTITFGKWHGAQEEERRTRSRSGSRSRSGTGNTRISSDRTPRTVASNNQRHSISRFSSNHDTNRLESINEILGDSSQIQIISQGERQKVIIGKEKGEVDSSCSGEGNREVNRAPV